MHNDELTAAEAAEVAAVDRSTIVRWVQTGRLPARTIPGPKRTALYLFQRADVEAIAAARSGAAA